MLPFASAVGASDSADAARTSGSWTRRPDLATRSFGCRAENDGVDSNEAERKRDTDVKTRKNSKNKRLNGFRAKA